MSSIIDQIRVALNKRDGINEEQMRPLAEAYSYETKRVNARLGSAAELLRKGLRSEAIQTVITQPNSLDAAVELDFAEADEWFDILQFLGIPVPTPLRNDLVELLNETIVEAQPIESLLKQHRRLALARAPLPWRLKVLRRIAQLDPVNSFWNDDIEAYEKARKKQLPGAISQSIGSEDLEQLNTLLEEINDPNWLSPADKSLANRIHGAIEGFNSERSLKELQRLGPLLHDAFCEFDESHARQYLANWRTAEADYRDELPDALAQQFGPTADWIAQLDHERAEDEARNGALARLERTIERDAPLHELEQSYYQVTVYDEPIPEELARRYQLAVEAKTLSKKRRFQAAIVGLVAAALCIVGAFGWWQIEEGKETRIAGAESEFKSLIASDDRVGARTFYDQLKSVDSDTASTANILTLVGQLESLEAAEQNRAAEFAGNLARADAEDPAEIDLSSLFKAENLASTENEKAAAFELRSRQRKWESEVSDSQSQELRSALLQQRKILDEMEQQQASDQLVGTLAGVIAKLQPLPGQFPRASASLQSQTNLELQRAGSLRSAIIARLDKQSREEAAMASFLRSTSLADLTRNLKRYQTEFPSSRLSSDFAVVANEDTFWRSVDQWNALMTSAAELITAQLPKDRVSELETASEAIDFDSHPAATTEVRAALQPIFLADKRREIFDEVLLGLEEAVFGDLYTIIEAETLKKERRFAYKTYVDSNSGRLFKNGISGSDEAQGAEVVVNSSGAIRNTSLNGKLERYEEPKATIDWLVSVGKTRQDKFVLDWEGEYVKIIAELLKRPQLDSLIKEMLLQHVLAGASQGSDGFRDRLVDSLQFLNERANQRDTWFEPKPLNNSIDSKVESQVVPLLKTLYGERRTISDDLAALRLAQIRWIGMLTRDATGKIAIHLQSNSTPDGTLYVLNESSSSPGTSVWVDVGSVKGNDLNTSENLNLQLAGRPVFLRTNDSQP